MKQNTYDISNNRGFTLVEVLVAMVILSIGIIALTSMQTTGIKGNATSNILTTGGTWAADSVERIFAMEYEDLKNATSTSVDGKYSTNWQVTNNSPLPNTKTVTITVTSSDGGDQRRVAVNYIIAKYVK